MPALTARPERMTVAMMEGLFLEVLRSIQRFLQRRRDARRVQTAAQRRAVESVLDAVRVTEGYLYDLGQGGSKDRTREAKLSRLWQRAATHVRAVDARLSRIAQVNAFGWANPDLWDHPEYGEIPIELDVVRRQCEWLLDRWYRDN
jgi:hypothetical protein